MSTTPRTDAELFDPVHYSDQGGSSYGQMRRAADGDYVPSELARQLERELAAAKKDSAAIVELIRLHSIIASASVQFFCEGSDGDTASKMLNILNTAK